MSKRAKDMALLIAALWVMAAILLGCFHRNHNDGSDPPPADYSAPVWTVSRDLDPALVGPTPIELKMEYDRVTHAWLEYWRARSKGLWRPSTIPKGSQVALVEIVKECSNSAESPGRGAYGVKVYGWSCSQGQQRTKAFMLSAVCHRLSHVLSGLSGGNHDHGTFAEVAGC